MRKRQTPKTEAIEVWRFTRGTQGEEKRIAIIDRVVIRRPTYRVVSGASGCTTGPLEKHYIETAQFRGKMYRVRRTGRVSRISLPSKEGG